MNAAALQEILTLSKVARTYGVELGANESQNCPFCSGSKQLRTTRNRWYHCFKCGRRGDIYRLLQDLKVTKNFRDSFNLLSQSATNSPEYQAYRTRINGFNKAWVAYQAKGNDPEITQYCADRGWTLKPGEVGYADSAYTLRQAGFSIPELETLGLYAYGTEHYSNHLIFPIYNHDGEVVHFSARALDPKEELRWKHTAGTPPINNYLYGAQDLGTSTYAVLCEGISDSRSLIELGEPAVGVFGVTIPLVQHAALFRQCKCLVAFFDRDRYPLGHEKQGQYKSWSQVTPHLVDLAIELQIPVLCLMAPNWPGVKDANEYLTAIDYDRPAYQTWASKSYRQLHSVALEVLGKDLTQHASLWRLHAAVPNPIGLEEFREKILKDYDSWESYLLALHA